jgi:hypothetical protein
MLAGVVEQLCFDHELVVPGWVMRPGRYGSAFERSW